MHPDNTGVRGADGEFRGSGAAAVPLSRLGTVCKRREFVKVIGGAMTVLERADWDSSSHNFRRAIIGKREVVRRSSCACLAHVGSDRAGAEPPVR